MKQTVWHTYAKQVIKKAARDIVTAIDKTPDRMPLQILISIVPEGYKGETAYVIRRSYTISKEAFNGTADSQPESTD